MRNDLIVLEFYNPDSAEVLLSAQRLAECSDALYELLNHFVPITMPGDQIGMHPTLNVALAAFGAGCIKVGFKIIVKGGKQSSLSKAADYAQILSTAMAGVLFAGHMYGYFDPVGPADAASLEPPHQLSEQAVKAPETRRVVEHFTQIALNCGAKHVRIMFPEPPTCELVDASNDPSLLAFTPTTLKAEHVGPFEGEVSIVASPISVQIAGEAKSMALGKIMLESKPARRGQAIAQYAAVVLLDWRSSQALPAIGEKVEVRGTLRHTSPDQMKTEDPITRDHRSVAGVLTVNNSRGWYQEASGFRN